MVIATSLNFLHKQQALLKNKDSAEDVPAERFVQINEIVSRRSIQGMFKSAGVQEIL
jgi:hypothetical protein